MARNRQTENDMADSLNETEATEATATEATATEAPTVADEPIEPGVVTVENAVSEDQMRQKVARMARGRKNYELCGTLRASSSTISNFIKGKGGATKQMLSGLGVEERTVYVVTDPAAFAALGAASE